MLLDSLSEMWTAYSWVLLFIKSNNLFPNSCVQTINIEYYLYGWFKIQWIDSSLLFVLSVLYFNFCLLLPAFRMIGYIFYCSILTTLLASYLFLYHNRHSNNIIQLHIVYTSIRSSILAFSPSLLLYYCCHIFQFYICNKYIVYGYYFTCIFNCIQ